MTSAIESIYMTNGKYVRKLHYGNGQTGGYAWIRAPFKKVRHYASCGLVARRNLAERMIKEEGWWYA